jgi:hypothetical protein
MRLILGLLLLSRAAGAAPRRCRGRDHAPCRRCRAAPTDRATCRTGWSHHPGCRFATLRTIPTSGHPRRRPPAPRSGPAHLAPLMTGRLAGRGTPGRATISAAAAGCLQRGCGPPSQATEPARRASPRCHPPLTRRDGPGADAQPHGGGSRSARSRSIQSRCQGSSPTPSSSRCCRAANGMDGIAPGRHAKVEPPVESLWRTYGVLSRGKRALAVEPTCLVSS